MPIGYINHISLQIVVSFVLTHLLLFTMPIDLFCVNGLQAHSGPHYTNDSLAVIFRVIGVGTGAASAAFIIFM